LPKPISRISVGVEKRTFGSMPADFALVGIGKQRTELEVERRSERGLFGESFTSHPDGVRCGRFGVQFPGLTLGAT